MKIKILYILSVLFIFSCDAFDEIISELDESEVQLEYDYYIQEGWDSVESQDFPNAINFFDYIISVYESSEGSVDITGDLLFEAYHGFAWSNLFVSNTLYGPENSDQRLAFRDISYDAFFIADSILNSIDFSSSEYSFDYDCDILAGKALHHDYKIYYYLNQYFSYDGDLEYLDNIDVYSNGEQFTDLNENGQYDIGEDFIDLNNNNHFELGLENLVNQMNDNCFNYDFPYESIDINSISMMLVKDYIRKGMYQEAVDFIDSLDLPSATLDFNVQVSEQDLDTEMYLIGDFLNKTIDSNDLYAIDLDTESARIEVIPYLPCNFDGLENDEDLRDELLDCVDIYFETNSEVIFRYKYVNGSYSESIYNQETNLSSQCSDNEGYRTLTIDLNSIEEPIVINDCYNSCSSSCFNN